MRMPILSNFTVSERAERNGPNNLILINPKNTFNLPFLPTVFSFTITFGVLGITPFEKHTLQFEMFAPDGTLIGNTGIINFESNQKDPNFPIEANGLMMNFDLTNIILENEGLYKSVIKIDNKIIGERVIYILDNRNHNKGDSNG